MAAARKNFVFGVIPRVTRPSGFYMPFTRSSKDPLVDFLAMVSRGYDDDPGAEDFARENPEDMLDVFLRDHAGYVLIVIGGDITLYSTNRDVQLPPKIARYLNDLGITGESKIHWYNSAYSSEATDILAASDVPAGTAVNRSRLMPGKSTPSKIADLRRKFWAGQTDPRDAQDIVDILIDKQ